MKLLITLLITLPLYGFGQETGAIPYIRNDDFVSNAFEFPLTVKNLEKQFGDLLSISKKPINNNYDKSIVDTLYTFFSGNTKIEIYHSSDNDILESAFIDTDKISLKYNIKIGDTKSNISKLFKTKISADKVQVGDLENESVYTFIFSNDKLISISYEGYSE